MLGLLLVFLAPWTSGCSDASPQAGAGGGIADVSPDSTNETLEDDVPTDAPPHDSASMAADTAQAQDGRSSAGDVPVAMHDTEGPADGGATSEVSASPLGPPYPVVLVHGFFGTDKFADLDFATYFFEVKQDLAKAGEFEVFTPALDPFNDSQTRAAELWSKVQAILAKTGRQKVILVGHSQGGLDARVLAHTHPQAVAAVVTIATPHKGTKIADIAMKLVASDSAKGVIDAMAQFIGAPIYGKDGKESSVSASIQQFTTASMKSFNTTFLNAPGVSYFSVAGRSGLAPHLPQCTPDEGHEFVVKLQPYLDPVDPLFVLTESLIDGSLLKPEANDGLVRVKDAKWGTFLGCVPADHIDQVGHLFGDKPGLINPFDHKKMFRWLVAMLRVKGF